MDFQSNQPKGETKECKYCGSEIPAQAKVCPYCNKKQSHTVRNVVLIVVGVIVLLVLLFSCMGGGGNSESGTAADTGTETTTQSDNVASDAESDSDTSQQGTSTQSSPVSQDYTVGSTFEENGISVTLDSVTQSTGGQYSVPTEGNVFLVTTWTVTNNTDEDYINLVEFDGYVDSSKTDEVFHSDVAETLSPGESLIPGSSITASKLYEVPAGWTQFQERVQIEGFGGESATFIFTPNQVS